MSKRIKKSEIPKKGHFSEEEEEEEELEEEEEQVQEVKKTHHPRSERKLHLKKKLREKVCHAKKPAEPEKRPKSSERHGSKKGEQKIEKVSKSSRLVRSGKLEKGSFEKNDVPEKILGCISGANVEKNKREFLVKWYERKDGVKMSDSIQTAEKIKENCADLLLNFYEEGYYLG